MKLLLATNHLGLGGSESYLLTVAEYLDRFGHEVTIYAPEGGGGCAVARERNLGVALEVDAFEGDFDAAIVQDGAVSHEVFERRPDLAQLFVAHSTIFDLQAPPQLDDAVAAVVALNDRVARRMRNLATEVELVRMTQPIDTQRFVPRASLPDLPRRALLLSNTPHADRMQMIESASAEAGLELRRLGGVDGAVADIRPALAASEIVIGYGRSILEAMACGRAAYVYDWHGGDGWVTAESYEAIEAGGFAGRTGRRIVGPETLVADLRRYSSSMGPVNHDLVTAHHRAGRHTEELVELLSRIAPRPPAPRESPREMARLVRLEWRAQLDVQALRRENAALAQRLHESELVRLDLCAKLEMATVQGSEAQAQADYLESERRRLVSSFSWKLTTPLRQLAAKLRAIRSR
jgi:hypothetical protein